MGKEVTADINKCQRNRPRKGVLDSRAERKKVSKRPRIRAKKKPFFREPTRTNKGKKEKAIRQKGILQKGGETKGGSDTSRSRTSEI